MEADLKDSLWRIFTPRHTSWREQVSFRGGRFKAESLRKGPDCGKNEAQEKQRQHFQWRTSWDSFMTSNLLAMKPTYIHKCINSGRIEPYGHIRSILFDCMWSSYEIIKWVRYCCCVLRLCVLHTKQHSFISIRERGGRTGRIQRWAIRTNSFFWRY